MLAIIGWIASWRSGARTGRVNALALVASLLFAAYLGNQVATVSRVPAIHDAATDLGDLPRFTALAVRPENLAKIPDNDRPELAAMDPEAVERRCAANPMPTCARCASRRARQPSCTAPKRSRALARVDPRAGIVEATATTLFFRFKDHVVVRVWPDPARPGPADRSSTCGRSAG